MDADTYGVLLADRQGTIRAIDGKASFMLLVPPVLVLPAGPAKTSSTAEIASAASPVILILALVLVLLVLWPRGVGKIHRPVGTQNRDEEISKLDGIIRKKCSYFRAAAIATILLVACQGVLTSPWTP